MRLPKMVLLASCLAVSLPALASLELAQDKQCTQCHKMNEDFAGPSFHAMAQKYKGQKGPKVQAQMVTTIRKGSDAAGGPHWGTKAKMPDASERPTVSKDEAIVLAKWILKQ